jgi:hypothetical protein
MAYCLHLQNVYLQVTAVWLLAKSLQSTSIAPESPVKLRQTNPRFTALQPRACGCAGLGRVPRITVGGFALLDPDARDVDGFLVDERTRRRRYGRSSIIPGRSPTSTVASKKLDRRTAALLDLQFDA